MIASSIPVFSGGKVNHFYLNLLISGRQKLFCEIESKSKGKISKRGYLKGNLFFLRLMYSQTI